MIEFYIVYALIGAGVYVDGCDEQPADGNGISTDFILFLAIVWPAIIGGLLIRKFLKGTN